jgi:hypothetical protein
MKFYIIVSSFALVSSLPSHEELAAFVHTEPKDNTTLVKRSLLDGEDFNGIGTCFGDVPCGTDGGKTFDDWLSNFMGTSNLENYYVSTGTLDENFRGNNDDGIWISDGDLSNKESYIRFTDSSYSASITSFSLDIGSHVSGARIVIYDKDLTELLNEEIPKGCSNCMGGGNIYFNFGVTSTNGVAGFDIISGGIEGNVGIDNVLVETGSSFSCEGKAIGYQECDNEDINKYHECSIDGYHHRDVAPGTDCCNWPAAQRVILVMDDAWCPFDV